LGHSSGEISKISNYNIVQILTAGLLEVFDSQSLLIAPILRVVQQGPCPPEQSQATKSGRGIVDRQDLEVIASF